MRALLYSHLFLSICAIAMIAETALLFNLWNETTLYYTLFVFFATLVAYNIKGLAAVLGRKNEMFSAKELWALSNKTVFLTGYFLSGTLALLLLFYLPYELYGILFLLSLVAITYSLPIQWGRYSLSPRVIPFFKTLLVAVVWTIVVVYVPCRINAIAWEDSYLWILGECLFLFSLSVLFDIKDVTKDQSLGVKTLPQLLGVGATKILSIFLMGGRVIMCFFLHPDNLALEVGSSMVFVSLIYVVTLINTNREEKFYMLSVDGLMLIRVLIFFFCKKLIN